MKNKTALKQSKGSVRFLAVAIPIVWALYVWLNHWTLLAIGILMTLFFIGDVANIILINRNSRKDPGYLQRKID